MSSSRPARVCLWLAGILAALLGACGGGDVAGRTGALLGQPAPELTLEDLDGRRVALSEFEGQVVLVNLWATWCRPCQAEIPVLEAAYRDHKADGLVVLGINVGEHSEAVRPFVEAMRITYPVLLDEESRSMVRFRAVGLPTSILVDREGVIQTQHQGELSARGLDAYLAHVLPRP